MGRRGGSRTWAGRWGDGRTWMGRRGGSRTWAGSWRGALIRLHPLCLSRRAFRSVESTFCGNCEVQRLGIREVQYFALDNIPEMGLLPLEPLAPTDASLAGASRPAGRGTRADFGARLFSSFLGRPGRRDPFGYFRLLRRLRYRRFSVQISLWISAQRWREYL